MVEIHKSYLRKYDCLSLVDVAFLSKLRVIKLFITYEKSQKIKFKET